MQGAMGGMQGAMQNQQNKAAQEEKQRAAEEQRAQILKAILEPPARERCTFRFRLFLVSGQLTKNRVRSGEYFGGEARQSQEN